MEATCDVLELSSGNTVSKKTFAIATLGAAAIALLTDILAPTSLGDSTVTFDVMKSTLQKHMKAQRLEMAERAVFYNTSQRHGEPIASFFA